MLKKILVRSGKLTTLIALLPGMHPSAWAFQIYGSLKSSDFSQFQNAPHVQFSCTELRVLTLVRPNALPAFCALAKMPDEYRDAWANSPQWRAYLAPYDEAGALDYRSKEGGYRYHTSSIKGALGSKRTLLDAYNNLVSYFGDNPFRLKEYMKYPASQVLKDFDCDGLQKKVESIMGDIHTGKTYLYTPPHLAKNEPGATTDGDSNHPFSITQFNFGRTYTLNNLLAMKDDTKFQAALNEVYPDPSDPKRQEVQHQRDRFFHSTVITGSELDCNEPRPEFREFLWKNRLADLRKLERSGRLTSSEITELAQLQRYAYLQPLVENWNRFYSSGAKNASYAESHFYFGLHPVTGIKEIFTETMATMDQVAEYQKLQKVADQYYDSGCGPINFANATGYYAAYTPTYFTVAPAAIDFIESRNACQDFSPTLGVATFSKYPMVAAKSVAVPQKMDYDAWNEELREHKLNNAVQDVGNYLAGGEPTIGHDTSIGVTTGQQITVRLPRHRKHDSTNTETTDVDVLNFHAQANAVPKVRAKQFSYFLDHTEDTHNPTLLGGDLNTNNSDGRILYPSTIIRNQIRSQLCLPSEGSAGMSNFAYAENIATNCILSYAPVPGLGGTTGTLITTLGLSVPSQILNNYDPTRGSAPEYGLFQQAKAHGFHDNGKDDNLHRDSLGVVADNVPIVRNSAVALAALEVRQPTEITKSLKSRRKKRQVATEEEDSLLPQDPSPDRREQPWSETNERNAIGFVPTVTSGEPPTLLKPFKPVIQTLQNGKIDWIMTRQGDRTKIQAGCSKVLRRFDEFPTSLQAKDPRQGMHGYYDNRFSDHFALNDCFTLEDLTPAESEAHEKEMVVARKNKNPVKAVKDFLSAPSDGIAEVSK